MYEGLSGKSHEMSLFKGIFNIVFSKTWVVTRNVTFFVFCEAKVGFSFRGLKFQSEKRSFPIIQIL